MVHHNATKFHKEDIDLAMMKKLDRMFMNTIATGDHAWAPSSGVLPSESSNTDTIQVENTADSDESIPVDVTQDDCIGVIDSTHIPVSISPEDQIPYIGRKGIPTQNVMAACDFKMQFILAVAGWEGTAHDSRIFQKTIRDPALNFPKPLKGVVTLEVIEQREEKDQRKSRNLSVLWEHYLNHR
ncbi:hypothetical protein Ddye_026014 [Dipteronia dyeriana]|uniref:DDE Tnp4 domain-containing protein n=1 Tax=Dipteronia dyeriana TaxID=168575 RepID=A0AAD9WNR4_9ROSI|nr:hypothetical protein Ddye_026014 [Dipteronia dyeriana]